MRKALFLLTLSAALSTVASAGTVYSRALPVANLNDAAGANRSNVAWVSGQISGPDYYIIGDDFALSNNTTVNGLTIWGVANNTLASGISDPSSEFSSIRLYGGAAGGPLSLLSSAYTSQLVTYAGGASYQGSSGTFYPIYAITFTNLNWAVLGGTVYNFAVDATVTNANYTLALHASNAAAGGIGQDGSNGVFNYYRQNGAQFVFDSFCDSGAPSCGGFDKSTDINLLLDDTAVPEPSTILLTGIGVLALAGLRRRAA